MEPNQTEDIRWEQRFSNYQKAVLQLEQFVKKGDGLSDMEKQGLIKAFEYCFELGWNTLKDYLEFQGSVGIAGSRDTIREAFSSGLIEDGNGWMDMFKSRNKTVHTYNEKTADEVVKTILSGYWDLFIALEKKMIALQKHLPLV